jgi:hypothetical protein
VISADSIGRFREVLPSRQIAFIERTATPEMTAFGYLRAVTHLGAAQWVRYALADVPLESARLSAWRLREARRDRRGRPVPSYRIVQEPVS